MNICEYGCGQKATHQFKNGKWCCCDNWMRCINQRKRYIGEQNPFYGCTHNESTIKILKKPKTEEYKKKMSKVKKGFKHSEESKRKISLAFSGKNHPLYGKPRSEKTKKKMSDSHKITIDQLKDRYMLFSQIEEMRYNPDKLDEKEIQVHCKNHECENSKEKGGWFTPTGTQLYERIRQLEKEYGNGGCYLYCSQKCKDTCPLYNLQSDPYKDTDLPYTYEEHDLWRSIVCEQDNYECQKCGSKEDLHCHHIRPVKTHPHLALDPDNGITLCKNCHYEIGHKTGTECSTGNLSKIICN